MVFVPALTVGQLGALTEVIVTQEETIPSMMTFFQAVSLVYHTVTYSAT